MKHFGDITKISGYDVPIVDCVIGGSPCQELSIAGKREGLAGERSGLFMEQIRIIKEMRKADAERNRANGRADLPVRPRYMVWENVEGAFNSTGGKDFKAVLEETIRIAEPDAPDLPMPEKRWSKAGTIVGDGFSVSWRTHNAQHWGVPQRRTRISLIADFGGQSAPEILFECKSLSRNTEQGEEQRQGTSEGTERSIGNAISFQERGGKPGGGKGILIQDEHTGALRGVNSQAVYNIGAYDSNAWKSKNAHSGVYKTEVSKSLDSLNCGYPACNQGGMAVVQDADLYNHTLTGDIAVNLNASSCATGTRSGPSVVYGFDAYNQSATGDVAKPLTNKATDSDHLPLVMCFEPGIASRDGGHCYENIAGTLRANMGDNQSAILCLNNQDGSIMGVSEQEHGHQPSVIKLNQKFIEVDMPVSVRKYPIDSEKLCKCLREHKENQKISNKDIAETLNIPLTKVEHWFRQDKCFAIPDADIWFDLKKMLGIKTDEFDRAITVFEEKDGTYDMRNRIYSSETSPTLTCGCEGNLHLISVVPIENHPNDSRVKLSDKDLCQSLTSKMGTGGGNVPMVMSLNQQGGADIQIIAEKSGCLTAATNSSGNNKLMVMAIDRAFFNAGKNALYSPQVYTDGINPTIVSKGPSAVCIGNGQVDQLKMSEMVGALNCMHDQQAVMQKKSVRRLTPLECERLQGFPDGWTYIGEWIDSKGKKHDSSDSARYKALGNSIALPFWRFLCKRISAQYVRNATMASLFDGIGGFPLVWEEWNGKGSAVWASEIEEFPIAVTKYHFGEE